MKPPEGRSGTSRWQVFVRTSLYLLGGSLQKAAYLLLLPFLVAVLTPEEFTRFGLMVSAIAILTPLFSLNAHLAPARLYFDYEESHHQAELLFSSLTGALGLVTLGLAACVCAIRLSGVAEPISLGSLNIQLWVSLVIVVLVAGDFGLVLIRIRGNAALFSVVSAVSGFGILAAFLALRWWGEDGFLRSIAALAAGRGTAAVISLGYASRYLRGARFRWGILGRSLSFSWPTAVHMLAIWGVSQSGRWIGTRYMALGELAPYILVTQITVAGMMISRALFEARRPEIGKAFARGAARLGVRIIRHTMLVGSGLVLVLYLGLYLGLFVLHIPLPASYMPTPWLLIMACVACVLDTFHLQGMQILYGLKQTRSQAVSTVMSGIVTVALSFVLASKYKDWGLIVAVAVGLGIQAVASNAVAWYRLKRHVETSAG